MTFLHLISILTINQENPLQILLKRLEADEVDALAKQCGIAEGLESVEVLDAIRSQALQGRRGCEGPALKNCKDRKRYPPLRTDSFCEGKHALFSILH